MDAQETRIYTAILITAIVLGSIIVYFIISLLRQQRKNLALHKSNILAEITQIEKERGRIASDLHDELGPLLSAVKMKINSFELSNNDDIIQIEKTNDHLDNVLKRLREISFDLMPNSLLRKGLGAAVNEFVDYLNNSGNIKFYFHNGNRFDLSEQKSVNLYRIIQEIVHNTIKHSDATELSIKLQKKEDKIVLVISENGKGFDFNKESNENSGFGLKSLLRRTEIMGGHMFLESEKGKGVTYTFEIPV